MSNRAFLSERKREMECEIARMGRLLGRFREAAILGLQLLALSYKCRNSVRLPMEATWEHSRQLPQLAGSRSQPHHPERRAGMKGGVKSLSVAAGGTPCRLATARRAKALFSGQFRHAPCHGMMKRRQLRICLLNFLGFAVPIFNLAHLL